MAPIHLSHSKETIGSTTSKVVKKILFAITLISLFSQSVFAHEFDISNPELLKIQLNDEILVRPPPMINPPTVNTQKTTAATKNEKIVTGTKSPSPTNMNQIIYTILGLAALMAAWIFYSLWQVRNIEMPEYEVIEKKDGYEIRKYKSYILAETEISGEMKKALYKGFITIADYIFGNNVSKKTIAMTAPVLQQEQSETIAMTAPVIQQKTSSKSYKIAFVMPSKYTLETLPKPKNSRVHFTEVKAYKAAVLRFSGFLSKRNIESKKVKLLSQLQKDHLKPDGEAMFAGYNPPSTPPFMRRNEIIVKIK